MYTKVFTPTLILRMPSSACCIHHAHFSSCLVTAKWANWYTVHTVCECLSLQIYSHTRDMRESCTKWINTHTHPYPHLYHCTFRTHTRHNICTHVHTYIHNCEGVKKAHSLVKNETNQRPPVLFSSLSSLLSIAPITPFFRTNTILSPTTPPPPHQPTPPPPSTIFCRSWRLLVSQLVGGAVLRIGVREFVCMCVRMYVRVCSYEQPVHVYACTCVHVSMCMFVHVSGVFCVFYSFIFKKA